MTAVVGLTGGIASGKSTVARIFRTLGVHVVDADRIAREIVAKGSDALAEIVDEFGAPVLAEDGSLDRKKLAGIVFADPERRRRLEAITHPRIAARSLELLGALAASGEPYGVYEAALLVENGSYRTMQALIVVAASPGTQRRRLRERDALEDEEADARLAAQLPLEKKLEVADYTIWNDGDLAALETATREVHRALLARFGASVDGRRSDVDSKGERGAT
jgi:dephospho-CoA kinase